MPSHSTLSPSGAARWMACPGSVREEARYPEEKSNEYSIDGTHSHTLLEACCMDDLVVDASEYLGKTLTDHDGEFTVTQDRVDRVQVAVDYVRKRKEELKPCAVRSEERVDPGLWIDREDLKGTADIQLISNTVLEVIDYKDGYPPVSVVDNKQLQLYALGALYPYYDFDTGKYPFTGIRMTIVQPKLVYQNLNPVSWVEMPVDELLNLLPGFRDAAMATDAPDAPLVPGEAQCKWCKARRGCEARASQALSTAQVLFGQVGMAQEVSKQDVIGFPDEKIREIIEALPLLRTFISDMEKEALRRFDTGSPIKGLKVVLGRGSRDWVVSEEDVVAKLKSMGVPKDSIYTSKLVSPAQSEKLKWENRKGEQKSLSPRQMEKLSELICRKDGKPVVVPESDSRPAVARDAGSIFKGVTVETVATVEADKPASLPGWLS